MLTSATRIQTEDFNPGPPPKEADKVLFYLSVRFSSFCTKQCSFCTLTPINLLLSFRWCGTTERHHQLLLRHWSHQHQSPKTNQDAGERREGRTGTDRASYPKWRKCWRGEDWGLYGRNHWGHVRWGLWGRNYVCQKEESLEVTVRKEEDEEDLVEALPDAHYGLLGVLGGQEVPKGHVQDLPEEVLREVFAHLPADDLYRNISLVCHHWRAVVMDPQVCCWCISSITVS